MDNALQPGQLVSIGLNYRYGDAFSRIIEIRTNQNGKSLYILANGQWLTRSEFEPCQPIQSNNGK